MRLSPLIALFSAATAVFAVPTVDNFKRTALTNHARQAPNHCNKDLYYDVNNCGECGHSCGPASQWVCNFGYCLLSCPNGCGAGQSCGELGCQCKTGDDLCDGACPDYKTDSKHCGGCNNACPAGQQCANGFCTALNCPPGQGSCDGGCVNLANDNRHCGACDNKCQDGWNCKGGICAPTGEFCPQPQQRCGDSCVNTQNDNQNCGVCGLKCDPGFNCNNHVCTKV